MDKAVTRIKKKNTWVTLEASPRPLQLPALTTSVPENPHDQRVCLPYASELHCRSTGSRRPGLRCQVYGPRVRMGALLVTVRLCLGTLKGFPYPTSIPR